MRVIKRAAIGFGLLLFLVTGVCVGLVIYASGTGQSPLERWIGQELRGVVNGYLVPQCDFDSLDYQGKLTVVLTNFRLTADDPDQPGASIEIVTAREVRLTLQELPSEGEPLRIKSLEIDGGRVRLIEPRGEGGLIGFSRFLKAEPDPDAPPVAEALQITRIDLKDTMLEYDSREPGTSPMLFEGIDTSLDISPGAGDTYGFDIALKRTGILDANLVGELNVDRLVLGLDSLTLTLQVDRENDPLLPPQVQKVLKQYDITGQLLLVGEGEIDLDRWQDSTAQAELSLADGYATAGEYRLPIKHLNVQGVMRDDRVEVRRIVAQMLEGEIRGDAVIQLNNGFDADVRLGGDGLDIEQTLRQMDPDQPARYAGVLDFDVSAALPLGGQGGGINLTGQGEASLRDGRIARVAVISDVIDFMETRGEISQRRDAAGRDRGDMTFDLRGDHAYIEDIEIIGSWFAMRGRGQVFFDDRLNMNINAGPMQKVQSALGAVGDVLGALTDGLVAYRVTGPFARPRVGVAPLSGIIGAPGERDRRRPTPDDEIQGPGTDETQDPSNP